MKKKLIKTFRTRLFRMAKTNVKAEAGCPCPKILPLFRKGYKTNRKKFQNRLSND